MGAVVMYVDPENEGKLFIRDDFVPVKSSADILKITIELENGKLWTIKLKRKRALMTDGSITTWWVFEGLAKEVAYVQETLKRWHKEKKIPRI